MKKILFSIIISFLLVIFTSSAMAQAPSGIYTPHIANEKKPVPYQYLREASVMWSKVIWRRINLTEKMNLPLYFPTEEKANRKSLIQLIMWGIKNKSLTPFHSDLFSSQYTMEELDIRRGAEVDTTILTDDEGEIIDTVVIMIQPESSEIKEVLLKEMWFYDKQRSIMEVRIIGLGLIRRYYRKDDLDKEDERQTIVCWIYYPEARNIFAGEPVYNNNNGSTTYTFDDIFFKRMFSGFIFKESNVYNDRAINQYTTGLNVLLESENIKKKIFDYEHDIWEY